VNLAAGRRQPIDTLDDVLGGRFGLSPVMVGRSTPLNQLLGLVDAAGVTAADLPAVALVAGEAGIGKTRLLRELVRCVPSPTVVLAGNADPGALGRPYELAGSLLGRDLSMEADPVRAALDLTSARIGSAPAVLLFEDLHWADAESVAVIDRLAQQPWPNVVIVGTYRPEDLSRRLPGGDLLLRLERRHDVEQVRLEPLQRAEVGALLGSAFGVQPPSSVIEALYQRSGGNPFVIEELVGCCRDVSVEDLPTVGLPWSLREVVSRQLEGLTGEQRSVVEAAAVCGASIPFDVLAAVAGLDEHRLLEVLRSLVSRGLLVESDDDLFGFRHALVRDAVEGQLLGRERRHLHERALEALRDHPRTDAASLAAHAAGAGRYEEMVEIAREGATSYLRQGSSFQALRLADEALAEAPDDVVLLDVATEAAWRVGLVDEAAGYASRWSAVAEAAQDPAAQVDAARMVARLAHERGDASTRDAAAERLRSLAERLGEARPAARAAGALAQIHMLAGEVDETLAWAGRAVEVAERIGAHDIAVQARIERGSILSRVPGGDGIGALWGAIREAEQIDDWVLVARGLNNLLDDLPPHSPEGREIIARYRDAAERAGYEAQGLAVWRLRMCEVAFGDADMPAARSHLGQARDWWITTLTKTDWYDWLAFRLAVEEGRLADAAAIWSRVRNREPNPHNAWAAWWAVFHDMQLASLGGRREEAQGHARELGRRPMACEAPFVHRDVIETVGYALEAGVPTSELREGFIARVGELETEPAARSSLLAGPLGLLHLAEGEHLAAVEQLGVAIDVPQLPRYVTGHLRVQRAVALLGVGRRDEARAEVRRALDEDLARWPGWRRDRADALARRLEGGAGGSGELTSREQEVIGLLAEGLTNNQLAQRLFISPKTAAVHVSNILTKLNLSTRAEAAAWAVRNGIADEQAS
jgi:DNA-binding CsgD family transcriptional regulator